MKTYNRTINGLIQQMHDEELNSTQVVDRADDRIRSTVTTTEDVKRAVSLGGMKVMLANSLDEIVRLRKELAEYEQIKFDSEADVFELAA